jgi:class 3 adenylate cyclase
MTASRRLAAILAADVAGYSRLMGADEEGTLERLKALRGELLDPKIADLLRRIADYPASQLRELLPWNWKHRYTPAVAS